MSLFSSRKKKERERGGGEKRKRNKPRKIPLSEKSPPPPRMPLAHQQKKLFGSLFFLGGFFKIPLVLLLQTPRPVPSAFRPRSRSCGRPTSSTRHSAAASLACGRPERGSRPSMRSGARRRRSCRGGLSRSREPGRSAGRGVRSRFRRGPGGVLVDGEGMVGCWEVGG